MPPGALAKSLSLTRTGLFDSPSGFLPLSPRKLISLWDMNEYLRCHFEDAHRGVLRWQNKLLDSAAKSDQKGTITSDERRGILATLEEAKAECRELELANSLHIIFQIKNDFHHPNAAPLYQQVGTQFRSLWNAMSSDISEQKFVFIPKKNEEYFFNENLWADAVYEVFHQAQDELNDVGHCLALDLYDAAVFHLMRVVEIGLRELAGNLNVKTKKTPLDYAGWDGVVKAINDKLESKIPKARGPKKSAALKFKQDLLADFKSFEVARNEIMHCRKRYDEKEAIGVFGRVHDFMERLAEQCSPPKKSNAVREVVKMLNPADEILNYGKTE
jgi:hypothetical protein